MDDLHACYTHPYTSFLRNRRIIIKYEWSKHGIWKELSYYVIEYIGYIAHNVDLHRITIQYLTTTLKNHIILTTGSHYIMKKFAR